MFRVAQADFAAAHAIKTRFQPQAILSHLKEVDMCSRQTDARMVYSNSDKRLAGTFVAYQHL